MRLLSLCAKAAHHRSLLCFRFVDMLLRSGRSGQEVTARGQLPRSLRENPDAAARLHSRNQIAPRTTMTVMGNKLIVGHGLIAAKV